MPVPVIQAARGETNESSTVTSHNPSLPAGIVQGELLLCHIVVASNLGGTWTSGSGYIVLADREDGGGVVRSQVWGKVAGASEAAASFTSSSGCRPTFNIIRVAGIDAAGYLDGTPSTAGNSGNVTTLTVPGITTAIADELLLLYMALGNTTTFTQPAGMTKLYDVSFSSNSRAAGMAYEGRPTAGATGDRTYTSSTSHKHAGILMAIKPTPSASTGVPYSVGILGA